MNGLVSIVSDSVGTAKIMDDNKNVLLYPCGNVDLLSSKIEWVINNYDKARKIGEASRTIYDKYFSMKKFVASINDLGLWFSKYLDRLEQRINKREKFDMPELQT